MHNMNSLYVNMLEDRYYPQNFCDNFELFNGNARGVFLNILN